MMDFSVTALWLMSQERERAASGQPEGTPKRRGLRELIRRLTRRR